MTKILGLYFSGTGNTSFAVKRFVAGLSTNQASTLAITDPKAIEEVKNHDLIIFAYPIYFSDAPKIVKDYINENKDKFFGKQIFVIATQGVASGDGAGVGARLFKKHGAKVVGGLHVKMSDSVADAWVYRNQNHAVKTAKSSEKIDKAVARFVAGKPTKHGFGACGRVVGFSMQRLWFGRLTKSYRNKPKISHTDCVSCGACVRECPLGNLQLRDGELTQNEKCTLCYRCVNLCPNRALTILGRKVYKQHIQE
ncbi:MAG: EFR1 family ferrodoxin [Firmicutes bacterium]|nr:EFR1 family ferrodoxin [Bacillota bacterium]